jgi:hypothetical protein
MYVLFQSTLVGRYLFWVLVLPKRSFLKFQNSLNFVFIQFQESFPLKKTFSKKEKKNENK